jgi:hypothetical protein
VKNGIRAMVTILMTTGFASAQPAPAKEDPWQAVRFMTGEWEGESDGLPGRGTVKRSYRFVLGDKFLHEQNVSTYPAQPKNPKGEVHEHWSFFSYDRARQKLVLRQFHQEGFFNQYAMLAPTEAGRIVFESEALENIPSGWKARESYDVVSQTSSSRPSNSRAAPARSRYTAGLASSACGASKPPRLRSGSGSLTCPDRSGILGACFVR